MASGMKHRRKIRAIVGSERVTPLTSAAPTRFVDRRLRMQTQGARLQGGSGILTTQGGGETTIPRSLSDEGNLLAAISSIGDNSRAAWKLRGGGRRTLPNQNL